ncbi:hypothetical protein [Mesorhizobium sp. ISC15]|uniref:hypothetical protein n=1 Tax=Mesorhizobium sp. ISC15 TaxID=3076429 RepID=UPI00301D2552
MPSQWPADRYRCGSSIRARGDRRRRPAGTALGLANSLVFIAFFLVPIAIPGLLVFWSWAGVWLAAAFCALIAGPIFLRPEHGRKSA